MLGVSGAFLSSLKFHFVLFRSSQLPREQGVTRWGFAVYANNNSSTAGRSTKRRPATALLPLSRHRRSPTRRPRRPVALAQAGAGGGDPTRPDAA